MTDCSQRTETTSCRPSPASPLLFAAHNPTLLASIGLVDVPTPAQLDSRELSGLILPFGEVGHTNIGPVTVALDFTLELPTQLRDVKLVDEHQHPPRPIGYMTAQRRADHGYRAAFHVPSTPLGDEALLLASEQLREGFSVELDDMEFNAAGELTRGTLVRVAHVTTAAFASARHDGLAASRNTHREDTTKMLTDAQRARLAELLAIPATDRTPEQTTELDGLVTLAASTLPERAPEPTDAERLAELEAIADADRTPEQITELDELRTRLAPPAAAPAAAPAPAMAASRGAARVPELGGARRRTAGSPDRLREFYAATARVLSGRSKAHLEAALSPITNTANIWVAADEYAGQLWDQVEYQRRYVQNSQSAPLNSWKGSGWRWDVRPEVADYAGDKTAVPSNAPTTEDDDWVAARLAGAHDLDRKFKDFGDNEFIEEYFRAMRESYARKSDAKAAAFQLASAVSAGAAGLTMFHAAAVAAASVEDTTGEQVDFIYVNSTDRLGLLNMTQDDVPPFLDVFGITPGTFKVAPGVAAGTVYAGVKNATRFRELTDVPIRVEAINMANGGIDGGVFGYYATQLLMPGGIVSATFDATP